MKDEEIMSWRAVTRAILVVLAYVREAIIGVAYFGSFATSIVVCACYGWTLNGTRSWDCYTTARPFHRVVIGGESVFYEYCDSCIREPADREVRVAMGNPDKYGFMISVQKGEMCFYGVGHGYPWKVVHPIGVDDGTGADFRIRNKELGYWHYAWPHFAYRHWDVDATALWSNGTVECWEETTSRRNVYCEFNVLWLLVVTAPFGTIRLAIALGRRKRRRGRIKRGKCIQCGYDLRAHQAGERCPECGMIISTAAAPRMEMVTQLGTGSGVNAIHDTSGRGQERMKPGM